MSFVQAAEGAAAEERRQARVASGAPKGQLARLPAAGAGAAQP